MLRGPSIPTFKNPDKVILLPKKAGKKSSDNTNMVCISNPYEHLKQTAIEAVFGPDKSSRFLARNDLTELIPRIFSNKTLSATLHNFKKQEGKLFLILEWAGETRTNKKRTKINFTKTHYLCDIPEQHQGKIPEGIVYIENEELYTI